MTLQFLVDAQLPPALAEALRKAGSDVVHVVELGLTTATAENLGGSSFSLCSAYYEGIATSSS